jgi:small subunit ribosomal protein S20
MANIKSAEKRIRQTAKKQTKNRSIRTRLRSAIKAHRAEDAAGQGKKLPETYSEIDTALKKGVIHRNAAARYKSRLARKASAKA